MPNGILVVDDAAFMRMMIKDVLTKNGYTVVGEAENGQKAIEKFSMRRPHAQRLHKIEFRKLMHLGGAQFLAMSTPLYLFCIHSVSC